MTLQQANFGPNESPNEELERAHLRDNAAEALEARVEEALSRAGKIEAFAQAQSTEELNTDVQEVVQVDVNIAERKVNEISDEIEQAALVANIELGDIRMNVEFQNTDELVAFLQQYKQTRGS